METFRSFRDYDQRTLPGFEGRKLFVHSWRESKFNIISWLLGRRRILTREEILNRNTEHVKAITIALTTFNIKSEKAIAAAIIHGSYGRVTYETPLVGSDLDIRLVPTDSLDAGEIDLFADYVNTNLRTKVGIDVTQGPCLDDRVAVSNILKGEDPTIGSEFIIVSPEDQGFSAYFQNC